MDPYPTCRPYQDGLNAAFGVDQYMGETNIPSNPFDLGSNPHHWLEWSKGFCTGLEAIIEAGTPFYWTKKK